MAKIRIAVTGVSGLKFILDSGTLKINKNSYREPHV